MATKYLENCFNRKYKLDLSTSENFEDYMRALGMSDKAVEICSRVEPVVRLSREADGKLKLSSESSVKNVSMTFCLDEEFDELTPDGRTVKSLIKVDANKLIQTQRNGIETITIREFTPQFMKITLKIGDVLCKRTYNYMDE